METKKTILIVDDSEFVRSYHSYILEQAHFQVITAVDGSDGLEKLYTQLLRPGSHRHQHEQHGRLRVHPAGARRRQVRLASHHHRVHGKRRQGQEKGFEAGANLYIVKPCSPEMMVENIRMILVGQLRRKERGAVPFSIANRQGRQILKLEGAVTIRHARDLAARLAERSGRPHARRSRYRRLGGHRHLYPPAAVFAAQDRPGAFLRSPSEAFVAAVERCGLRRELLGAREGL